jgi:hypothetical protein
MPGWMEGIQSFSTGRSAGIGLLLGAVNPKMLAMGLGAAAAIAAGGLTGGQDAVAIALYTLVAALGVLAPLVVTAVRGSRAQPVLDDWRGWLTRNNATVMAVLFLVFGVVLIGQGLQSI